MSATDTPYPDGLHDGSWRVCPRCTPQWEIREFEDAASDEGLDVEPTLCVVCALTVDVVTP